MAVKSKIPDPHEIILSVFETNDVDFFTEGNLSDFKLKLFMFAVVLLVLRTVFSLQVPRFLDIVFGAFIFYVAIEGLLRFFYYYNYCVKRDQAKGMVYACSILVFLIVILGIIV